jgi:hypothetical protein
LIDHAHPDLFLSPALRKGGTTPAFELKFLVDGAQRAHAMAWARANLACDPHGEAARDGAYAVTTLYLDTPEGDVYLRSPGYRGCKYRLRRYGNSRELFAECKVRDGDQVSKTRATVVQAGDPLPPGPDRFAVNGSAWFADGVRAMRLAPAALIAYERHAFAGTGPADAFRVTMDRAIRGVLWTNWQVSELQGGTELMADRFVLEFKFVGALPGPLKRLMGELSLAPGAVSKYRLCRDAFAEASRPVHSRESA